jgi:hypothetical protein
LCGEGENRGHGNAGTRLCLPHTAYNSPTAGTAFLLLETSTPRLHVRTLVLLTQHLAIVAQTDDTVAGLRDEFSVPELATRGQAALYNRIGLQRLKIKRPNGPCSVCKPNTNRTKQVKQIKLSLSLTNYHTMKTHSFKHHAMKT